MWNRSSHQSCSIKKVILEILQNSQESTCARVSFLIKLQAWGLRPATLLKKRLWDRCFPMNFVKILRTPFYRSIWTTVSGEINLNHQFASCHLYRLQFCHNRESYNQIKNLQSKQFHFENFFVFEIFDAQRLYIQSPQKT